ncbi:hypothetical protein AB0B94_28995 [Micromonospora sp. NPDC048986]|uniref:hypothetical protein n=1 Tax=Micromonospora sp. NPDC048986 TaxID=3155644 RepID=UPI0033FA27CB
MSAASSAAPAVAGQQIAKGMRTLPAGFLDERRAAYLTGRLGAQRAWYAQRSLSNRAPATRWSVSMLVVEIPGVARAASRAGADRPRPARSGRRSGRGRRGLDADTAPRCGGHRPLLNSIFRTSLCPGGSDAPTFQETEWISAGGGRGVAPPRPRSTP